VYSSYGKRGSQGALAINKDCAGCVCQPAEQGPSADIAFGDENTRSNRAEDNDVEVTQMIANEQTRSRHCAVRGHANTEYAARKAAPVMKPFGAHSETALQPNE
jgi:hypothetical protein